MYQKDQEYRDIENEVDRYKQIMGKNNNDVEHYQKIIDDLTEQNKKLNEKLTEIMFNKAALYKEKTL